MRKTVYFFTVLFIFFTVIVTQTGCSNDNVSSKKEIKEQTKNVKENESLIGFLEQSGNFINSHRIPTLISADDVRANLKKYLVIDIRRHNDYVEGHIDGAINVAPSDLVAYMKNKVAAGTYDKIVMVCYTGQTSGMATSVLRMMGYNTVYCLKWGMSSWNMKFAEPKWLARISDDYMDAIETTDNPKPAAGDFPEISTGNTDPKEILTEQANRLFAKGFGKMTAKIADVMGDPSAYYIINIATPEAYAAGHIPSAVNYAPKGSLAYDVDLNTLPTDKPILVYCATGQYAAQVVAYLRLLGYDAYTLLYGANSFMHKVLLEKGIHAFTKEVVNNFEYEESDFTGGAAEEEGGGGC